MAQVFKAKWILTAADEISEYKPVYEDSALVVENGIITDILPQSEIYDEVFETVEDFGNAVITPGFINLNANLHYKKSTNYKKFFIKLKQFFAMLGTPIDNYAMKLANIRAEIMSLDSKRKLEIFKENLKNEMVSGTTCFVQTAEPDKIGKRYFEILNKIPHKTFYLFDITADSVTKSRKVFDKLKKLIKLYTKNKADSTYFGLHPNSILTVHKKLWRILGKYSRRNDFILMFGLLESKEELDSINEVFSYLDYYNNFLGYKKIPYEKGFSAVEYLNNLKVFDKNTIIQNGNFLNSKEFELLSEAGVNMAFSPSLDKELYEKTLSSELILRNFSKRFGVMTGASQKTVLEELFLMELPENIEEMIKYITFYPAKILGISGITGSLDYNKHADFNVFKLNKKQKSPNDLRYNLTPEAVYILGRQIVKNGEITV